MMATLKPSFWNDRPVFVTGATGLVGGWLVKALISQGAHVVCVLRDEAPRSMFWTEGLREQVSVVHGDVCDQRLMERALGEYEIETVIHLAAQTIVGIANRNPISTFESNIQGTWSLLEACRRSPTVGQIVLASSDKAYGIHETLPYDETTRLQGSHPYDVSKSCADLIAQTYANTYNLPVAITRCGNFYGGGDLNWNRIVPGTIRSVCRSERPIIRSNGTFIRDYFYVEDGVNAYLTLAQELAERPELKGEAFNFSNESQITVKELVELVLRRMNSESTPEIRDEVTNEIPHQYLTAAKARRILNWTPSYSLEEGLDRTIAWYVRHLEGNDASHADAARD